MGLLDKGSKLSHDRDFWNHVMCAHAAENCMKRASGCFVPLIQQYLRLFGCPRIW